LKIPPTTTTSARAAAAAAPNETEEKRKIFNLSIVGIDIEIHEMKRVNSRIRILISLPFARSSFSHSIHFICFQHFVLLFKIVKISFSVRSAFIKLLKKRESERDVIVRARFMPIHRQQHHCCYLRAMHKTHHATRLSLACIAHMSERPKIFGV
jgi:hypothetical protein